MSCRSFRNLLAAGVVVAALTGGSLIAQTPIESSVGSWMEEHGPALVESYKHLHRNPELSFHEVESAKLMAKHLKGLGFEVTENIGGTGVVGILKNGEGPTVLVRTDTDALPLEERTGLDYASTKKVKDKHGAEVNVMHACGHDVHMSVWSGTAQYLATHLDAWQGTLLFIAQPAEERGAGARAMLADGLFKKFPKPDFALALHVTGALPVGKIGSCSGYALANVDSVDILVRGRGGHGSTPHKTHDPVVLAARIVVDLQNIVSREISAQEAAVVTVGAIQGGTKHNIIPDEVHLQITVRSYKPEVRKALLDAIKRTAIHEAQAAGFPDSLSPIVTVAEEEFTPATYNDPELVQRIDKVFNAKLGKGTVISVPPVMGGEDFGRYGPAAKCPSYIFWLGVTEPNLWKAGRQPGGPPMPSIHNSAFAPEPVGSLRTGVIAMTQAVLELMPTK
ncbi:MAG: amidohydrolase [Planctomycetes bacterium]|nr:amidohydrolase [Planctomycetota bacterium]